jgi:hypothetical protein
MPVKIKVAGIIDQPVASVFQFHARDHARNHPRWDPDIQLEQVTDGPMGVGTVLKRINSHSGEPVEGRMEVVEFEPDQAVGMIIKDGPTKIIARATYEAESEDRTLLTLNVEYPDLDEMDESRLASLMQRSLRNINQLLTSGA